MQNGCALTGNSNPVFLLWESSLEPHAFLHLFIILSMYFRIFLEKRIEQLLPQSHEPTFSVFRQSMTAYTRNPVEGMSLMANDNGHRTRTPPQGTAQGDRIKEPHKGTVAREDRTRGPHKEIAQEDCTRRLHKEVAQGDCTRRLQRGIAGSRRGRASQKGVTEGHRRKAWQKAKGTAERHRIRARHKGQLVFDLISDAINSGRDACPGAASEGSLINHCHPTTNSHSLRLN